MLAPATRPVLLSVAFCPRAVVTSSALTILGSFPADATARLDLGLTIALGRMHLLPRTRSRRKCSLTSLKKLFFEDISNDVLQLFVVLRLLLLGDALPVKGQNRFQPHASLKLPSEH